MDIDRGAGANGATGGSRERLRDALGFPEPLETAIPAAVGARNGHREARKAASPAEALTSTAAALQAMVGEIEATVGTELSHVAERLDRLEQRTTSTGGLAAAAEAISTVSKHQREDLDHVIARVDELHEHVIRLFGSQASSLRAELAEVRADVADLRSGLVHLGQEVLARIDALARPSARPGP